MKNNLKKIVYSLVVLTLTACSVPTTGNTTNNTNNSISALDKNLAISYTPGDTSNTNITASTGLTFSVDRLGKANRSINFNGIDQNIKMNIAQSKSIAISLWFKAPYNPKAYPTLFTYGEEIFHATLFGGTVYGARTGGIGNYAYTTTVPADRVKTRTQIELEPNYFDNNWHHFYSAYDREKNKMQLYIDNVLKGEKDIDKDLLSSTYIEIGHANSTAANETWYKGEMSDIKIYNRGLSAEEVALLYNEGK